jgi:hypothetical protein
MFGIKATRSTSSVSARTTSSSSAADEGSSVVTKDDIKLFGQRRFRSLCKAEGPEVAIRAVEKELRNNNNNNNNNNASTSGRQSTILADTDVWTEDDAVECVYGAAF